MNTRTLAIVFVSFLIVAGCKGTDEAIVAQQPISIEKDTVIKAPEPVREFNYKERYYIPGAVLRDPKQIDDAMQALRVIQFEKGSSNVLVIASISKSDEGDAQETWFGIELPGAEEKKYDLATLKAQFFRFSLSSGQEKRIDGKTYEGTLHVEGVKDGYLIGSLNATILGESKSFGAEVRRMRATMNGSFRIQVVNLEDTVIRR